MPFRSLAGGGITTSTWRRSVWSGGNWVFSGSPNITSYDSDDRWTMEGWDTPNFHKRKREGELLPYTNYVKFRTHSVSGSAVRWTKIKVGANGGEGFYPLGSSPSNIGWSKSDAKFLTSGDAKALANQYLMHLADRAMAAIYSKNTMDALTFTLELRKTLELFTKLPERLIALLKPGGRGGLPVTWLEYRYGWRILYYDILSYIQASNRIGDLRTRFTERVGFNQTVPPTVTEQNLSYSTGSQTGKFRVTTEFQKISNRGTVTVDTTALNPFQANPIVTAWELIPYSFIIDWVIGIGTWLQASYAELVSSGYAASSSIFCQIRRDILAWQTGISPSYNGELSQNGNSVSDIIIRIPDTIKSIPSVNIELDSQKLVDLMFLLKGYKNQLNRR